MAPAEEVTGLLEHHAAAHHGNVAFWGLWLRGALTP